MPVDFRDSSDIIAKIKIHNKISKRVSRRIVIIRRILKRIN